MKGGLEKGRWVIFYDEKQNIYNPEYKDGMEIIESYFHTKFKLFINCRNTVQIGTYCAKTSGEEISEYLQENGEEVQCISYSDTQDFKKKMKEPMKSLRSEKIVSSDVAFLAPKKYANSILREADVEVNELGEHYDPQSTLPKFATIQGFKGLVSKIVILVDVDKIVQRNFSKFFYIAGARARTLLYVVGLDEFWREK